MPFGPFGDANSRKLPENQNSKCQALEIATNPRVSAPHPFLVVETGKKAADNQTQFVNAGFALNMRHPLRNFWLVDADAKRQLKFPFKDEIMRTSLTNFKRLTVLATCITTGLALPRIVLAYDEPQPEASVQKVEVTGSYVKRAQAESVESVEIITQKDIERSGKSTVAELLRDLSANVGNSYSESSVNGAAPGAAGIGMRGLSQKNTLVLLNGQRIANYGFAENLQDTFVDLNIIPANAVDRIEVLKNGASAIYGSDAVAGVVNVILRQDFEGTVVNTSGGASTDGGMQSLNANLTTGLGNFDNDGYSLMLSMDAFKRDELTAAQRPYTRNLDYSNNPDGTITRVTAGAYLNDADLSQPLSAFPGCGTGGYQGTLTDPSTYNYGIGTGTSCAYNPASQTSLIPGVERYNIVANGRLKISPDVTGYANFFYSNNRTRATGTPSQLTNTSIAYDPATGGNQPVSNTLPIGNMSNPNATAPQDILYAFQDVGLNDYTVNSQTYRLVTGVKGSVGAWDWDAAVNHSENHVTQTTHNLVSVSALAAAIANNSYDFLNPSQTPNATSALRRQALQDSVSKLDTASLHFSSTLGNLANGPVSYAGGIEFRHESLNNNPDALELQGDLLNVFNSAVHGSRSVSAVFSEVDVPLLKNLEADLAARGEKYSDAGNAFGPKLGLRFQPTAEWLFRASASKGFRAPSLTEISTASATYNTVVSDPFDPLQRPSEVVSGILAANPKLKPEHSNNLGAGVVWSPTRDLNMSLDWYQIQVKNLIAAPSAQYFVDQNINVARNTGGAIETVSSTYQNGYHLSTDGWDANAKKIFRVFQGDKLSFDTNFTYVRHYWLENELGGPQVDNAGNNNLTVYSPTLGGALPHLRGDIGTSYETGNWMARISQHYTAGYDSLCVSVGACYVQTHVASHSTTDLYAEYNVSKNIRLYGSVQNLLNRQPPWDAYYVPFDPTLYDATGRYVRLGVEARF